MPTTGMQVLTSLGKTGKSKHHFCYYCKTMQLSIARHLERKHSKEELVKNFTSLQKRSEERRKLIDVIRKKGDFLHNTDKNYNQGYLITVRRVQDGKKNSEDMVKCPNCYGFYVQDNMRHHYPECTGSKLRGSRTMLQEACRKLRRVHQDASYKMVHTILPILRKNCQVTSTVKFDRLIILFGNWICVKYKKPHQDDMIRSQLRLLGNLVVVLRNLDSQIQELADVFYPKRFDIFLKAVQKFVNLR